MNLRQLVFSNTLSKNCWSKHLGQLFIVTSLSAAFPLWHPKKSQKKTSRNPPSSRAGIPYPLRKRERVPWLKKIGEKFPVPQKKRQRKLFQPSDFLFFFPMAALCDTTSRGFWPFRGDGSSSLISNWASPLVHWPKTAIDYRWSSSGASRHPKSHTNPRVSFQLVLMVQCTRTSNRNQTSLTTRT